MLAELGQSSIVANETAIVTVTAIATVTDHSRHASIAASMGLGNLLLLIAIALGVELLLRERSWMEQKGAKSVPVEIRSAKMVEAKANLYEWETTESPRDLDRGQVNMPEIERIEETQR